MNTLVSRISQLLRSLRDKFVSDSLFRNAAYLMSSTAIMSVLGFGFWFFVAHLYAPADIGVASALISITMLVSNLSFFGLNAGLLRFLPSSKTASRDINAAMIIVGVASTLAGSGYLLWIGGHLSGHLNIFSTSLAGNILFVILMAVVSLNTFTDSVFIANRRAELHTVVYAVFGVVKLILPIILISYGSLGIFAAYVAAATISLILSLVLMARYCNYQILSSPNWNFISDSLKYSVSNYVAMIVTGLPSQLLPTFIVGSLGGAEAAYFSMAWTMANLLYVIPSAIGNSLLAESSHDVSMQGRNVRHAVKILSLILVPAVILAILIAPFLLRLFGSNYSMGGTVIFQLLALSTFAIAANSIGNTIMNIERRSSGIAVVQIAITLVTLGLALPLMKFGLAGVGLAILTGNVTGNIVQLILLARLRKEKQLILVANHERDLPTREVFRKFIELYGLNVTRLGKDIGGGDRSGTAIITSNGIKYVLKVYNVTKRNSHQLEEELKFLQVLRSEGVPVPHIELNQQNKQITELQLGETNWLAVLMDFEPGRHPTSYNAKLLANMAHVQAQIHKVGLEFAKNGYDRDSSPSGSFFSTLIGYTPKGVSHFDYYRGNILTLGNDISCVIDFEGLRYDPLVACIFYTLTTLSCSDNETGTYEYYLKSYQDVRTLNKIEKIVIKAALAIRYHKLNMFALRF